MFNIQFHPRNSNSEVHRVASSSTVSRLAGRGGLVSGRALAWVTRPVVSLVSVVKRKLRQRELVSEDTRHNLMSAAHQTESSLASRSYLSEETSV